MEKEITRLLTTTLVSLTVTLAVEMLKHRLSASRAFLQAKEAGISRRLDRVRSFLQEDLPGERAAPGPAWLKQWSCARRPLGAEFGLKRDEDYPTHPVRLPQGGDLRDRLFPSETRKNVFLLAPSQVLGRSSRCDLQILDPAVSALHAVLSYKEGRFVLYDLESLTGTYVNGERVPASGMPLRGGEWLVLGSTVFRFSLSDPGEAEPDQGLPAGS